MHSLGAYANDVEQSAGGARAMEHRLDHRPRHVDLWIGGLAEKQNLFGGLLGSTFNFIFETQMEAMQDGDRLYYLPRIEGTALRHRDREQHVRRPDHAATPARIICRPTSS